MLQDFNLLALPQRLLYERAEQVRIRMLSELRNCLQSLAYDFGYFRHLPFGFTLQNHLRPIARRSFRLLLGERLPTGFLRQPAANIDPQVTHIDLQSLLRLPPAHPSPPQ